MTDRKLLEILHDNMVSAEYARVKQQILDGTSATPLALPTYRPVVIWTALAHKPSSVEWWSPHALVHWTDMQCMLMIGVCQRSR